MKIIRTSIFAAFACALSVPASARDLTLVDFGGMLREAFDKAYYQPYAAARGIAVTLDTTNGGLAKQRAMVEAGNVIWDVVEMEEDEVMIGCAEGLLADIDWTSLSNYAKSDPAMFIPCGAGAIIGTQVMSYDLAKVPDGPQNWADFWNVEKWPGKRSLRKTAKLTLELALMADGVPAPEVYALLATPEGQDRAFAKLDALKPHIQWWESGAQPLEWLASGAVDFTTSFNGRIATAQREGRDFAIIWNESLYMVDYWSVIAGSDNQDQAVDFIDFTLSTEQQKLFAESIPHGIANLDAMAALDPGVLKGLPSAPENIGNALKLDAGFWTDHGEELQERFSVWVAR